MNTNPTPGRRRFFKSTVAMSASLAGFTLLSPNANAYAATAAPGTGENIIGPKPGYSPQVGTMVSMLSWIQSAVTSPVAGMKKADLDYLFDANANSIGALLLHLAATETYYQMNTFQNMKWDSWSDAMQTKMGPGHEPGRRRPQNQQRPRPRLLP